jgi:hypothetical protein
LPRGPPSYTRCENGGKPGIDGFRHFSASPGNAVRWR